MAHLTQRVPVQSHNSFLDQRSRKVIVWFQMNHFVPCKNPVFILCTGWLSEPMWMRDNFPMSPPSLKAKPRCVLLPSLLAVSFKIFLYQKVSHNLTHVQIQRSRKLTEPMRMWSSWLVLKSVQLQAIRRGWSSYSGRAGPSRRAGCRAVSAWSYLYAGSPRHLFFSRSLISSKLLEKNS